MKKNFLSERFSLWRLNGLPVFRNAYYWFIAPLTILLIALICGTVYAFTSNGSFANIGVDFAGGTVMTVEVSGYDIQGSTYDQTIDFLQDLTDEYGVTIVNPQKSGTNAITFRYQNRVNGEDWNDSAHTEDMIELNQKMSDEIEARLKAEYPGIGTVTANPELINATASGELIRKAALSVGIALLLMVIYVMIRFDPYAGIATLISQIHDVLILLCGVIIFRIQINSTLIAAVITVVAYSINNTIVVLDRVREQMKAFKSNKDRKPNPGLIVDTSVAQSVTRSLFTSLTTLFTITVLACVGVQSLTEFALPIIFGVLAGIYSSLFIAPTAWGLMMNLKLGLHKGGKGRGRAVGKSRAASR